MALQNRLIASCLAALSLAATAASSEARAQAAQEPAAATVVDPAKVRPMSELKVAATIPIAKHSDWVKITPTAVWVASKGPFAVNEIDPATNQVTSVPLPGDPCAGLGLDADSLWVPLCGASPKLAKFLMGRRETELRLATEARVRELNRGFFPRVGAWMEQHVRSEELRPLPPDLWEPLLLGPSQEFGRLWLAGRTRISLRRAERELAEATWKAVRGDLDQRRASAIRRRPSGSNSSPP